MKSNQKILVIEPYYDGSHRAFIDKYIAQSTKNITLLTMPARKWKWRMRGSAMEMSGQYDFLMTTGHKFDAFFCTDMLNLAEFRGLSPKAAALPTILYFHENQFTYPNQVEDERDFQFGITNLTSAMAADKVLFNSQYHLDDFLSAAKKVLKKMPDFRCLDCIEKIRGKSQVVYPGISSEIIAKTPHNNPPKICWAARWEHDKNPEDFFEAVRLLREMDIDFRIHVIGQSFANSPEIFEKASVEFADIIHIWGYQKSHADYLEVLQDSDIFVSTANHEFYGISAIEAAASGCAVVVPNRLAYPEIFTDNKLFRYDNTVEKLASKIGKLIKNRNMFYQNCQQAQSIATNFDYKISIETIDSLFASLVK